MRGIVFTGKVEVRDDVEVRAPGPLEVRVRIHRAGLCHSDVSVIDGTIPFPTPVVLGHEGAGVVEEVGSAVTSTKPGDHVVLSTLGNCGACAQCDRGFPTRCLRPFGVFQGRFTVGGESAYQFANTSVFADYTVVHETQAVVIDKRVPLDVACLIGCGVLTGSGAVFNRAKVQPGESVVVIGAGGIGQSVIQGARLVGAGRIVAVDANPAKEATARRIGATHFVRATTTEETNAAIREILPRGADYAFECVGHPVLIRQAIDLLDVGGSAILLGVPGRGTEVSFVVAEMYNDKSIMSCRYGSSKPHHDIPRIVNWYLDGRYDLDSMVSQSYDLARIDDALHDLHEGKLNRGVLCLA